jgi:hypothetical protein
MRHNHHYEEINTVVAMDDNKKEEKCRHKTLLAVLPQAEGQARSHVPAGSAESARRRSCQAAMSSACAWQKTTGRSARRGQIL